MSVGHDRPPGPATDPGTSRHRAGRPLRVIWNTTAGSKAGVPTNGASEEQLRELMARHGLGDDLVATDTEDAAHAAVGDALARGYGTIVAAGGDGTASLVAFRLLGSDTALGLLPLGSAMNIARSLGIPRELEAAAAILARGTVRRIDVGEAEGEPFMEVGSVGLNAAIFGEAHRFDKGRYGSFIGLLRTVVRYRPARMRIRLDDRVVQTHALMVAVANAPFTGLGLTMAPGARLDDGRFDVRVFRGFSKTAFVRHVVSIVLGRSAYSPRIRTYRSTAVRIEAAHPRPCRVDDRDLGTTPVAFRVLPAALAVIAPGDGGPESARP